MKLVLAAVLSLSAAPPAVPVQYAVVDALYHEGALPTAEELTGRWVGHSGVIHADRELDWVDAAACAPPDRPVVDFGLFDVPKFGRMLAGRTEGQTRLVLTLKDSVEARLPRDRGQALETARCRLIGGVQGSLLCRFKQPDGTAAYKAFVKLRSRDCRTDGGYQ